MTLRATAVTVELRAPGSSTWTTLTNDVDAGVLPVNEVAISWGKPTPRDHPEPGAIGLELLVDDANLDALAYDTEVRVWARLEHYVDLVGWLPTRYIAPLDHLLARGWVTYWERGRRRREDGRYLYRLDAIDVLGRAAATNLGAAPWPAQTSPDRLAAINAASKAGDLLDPATSSWLAGRARDVDNAGALDVIRQEAALGTYCGEAADGIAGRLQARRYPLYLGATGAEELQFTWVWPFTVIDVPADILEDTGRRLDRGSVLSEVAVTCYRDVSPSAEPSTVTYRDGSPGSYSSSRYTVTTDHTYSNEAGLEAWADALVAGTQERPAVRIPAGRLLLLEDQVDGLEYMVRLESRGDIFVRIVDAPDDLEALHYVTAGALTIRRLDLELVVELAPARLHGVRPMRFSDLPTDSTTPRLVGTLWGPAGYEHATRISHTDPITTAIWPTT